MRAQIRWLPKARGDLDNIATYYLRISPSLVDSLHHDAECVMRQPPEFPLSYAFVTDELRRAQLNHFPYSLFYRYSNNQVMIAAVLPQRRKPRTIRTVLRYR